MFEMVVEDIFTITGRGTIFAGKIRSGSISVGDPVICKTRTAEMNTVVIGLEEIATRRLLKSVDAGANVAVVCRAIKQSSLSSAFEGEGDQARVSGVTLVTGKKKRWWQF